MNHYFYLGTDGQQKGPVPAESLKGLGVTKETLVWCEGMENWTKAGDVKELNVLFAPVPPTPDSRQPQACPDNYLVWSILATILCCWPLGIPAIINATKVEKLWAQGDQAGAKAKSEEAKKWCLISLGGGVLAGILSFIAGFAGAL